MTFELGAYTQRRHAPTDVLTSIELLGTEALTQIRKELEQPAHAHYYKRSLMFVALVTVTVVLALMCTASAAMKLRRDPRTVATINGTVGVPLRLFPLLAGLELAGAAGIVIGLGLEPLGIAAAAGLVAYFLGAAISHLRVGDTRGVASPALPLLLAIAVLALRLVTI